MLRVFNRGLYFVIKYDLLKLADLGCILMLDYILVLDYHLMEQMLMYSLNAISLNSETLI